MKGCRFASFAAALCVLSAIVGVAQCASPSFQWREVQSIDDFAASSTLSVQENVAIVAFDVAEGLDILGLERDAELRIITDDEDNDASTEDDESSDESSSDSSDDDEDGPGGVARVSVAEGVLIFTTSNGTAAQLTLQYDGLDDSEDVDRNGLGAIDLPRLQVGDGLLLRVQTDATALLFFHFYSGEDALSMTNATVFASAELQQVFVPFFQLRGDADLSRLGALVVFIRLPEGGTNFALHGLDVVTTATRLLLVLPFENQCSISISSSDASPAIDTSDVATQTVSTQTTTNTRTNNDVIVVVGSTSASLLSSSSKLIEALPLSSFDDITVVHLQNAAPNLLPFSLSSVLLLVLSLVLPLSSAFRA